MTNKRAGGHAGGRLKRTYNTKWIFAYCPDSEHYELLMKVTGSRQCYETVKTPSRYFDMDYLIETAEQHKVYSPIIAPQFVRRIQ